MYVCMNGWYVCLSNVRAGVYFSRLFLFYFFILLFFIFYFFNALLKLRYVIP